MEFHVIKYLYSYLFINLNKMTINLKNFLNPMNKLSKMRDFQDSRSFEKDVSISAISADLYENMTEGMILHCSILMQWCKVCISYILEIKIVSENIKYNRQDQK